MNLREAFMASKLLGGEGGAATIQPLSVSANGEYTVPEGVDGFSPVTVSVPASAVVSGTVQLSENGTFDVTQYANAEVNVSGGGGVTWDSIMEGTWDGVITGGDATTIQVRFSQLGQRLTRISFPNVTQIGSWAFAECRSLGYADFPQVTSIASYAFSYCANLSFVNMPQLTRASQNAFYNCSALREVSFPKLTSIASSMFECGTDASGVGLRYGFFPAATWVGSNAFAGNTNMSWFYAPDISSWGAWAFARCSELRTICVGSIASFPQNIFKSCWNLISVYLTPSQVMWPPETSYCSSSPLIGYTDIAGENGYIYVPASVYDLYINDARWSLWTSHLASYTEYPVSPMQ